MQLVTRIDDDLASEIDRLVESGQFESRSHVVRAGVVDLIDRRRREEIGLQIVEGYRRIPETEEELSWAKAATRAMIDEEPW